MSQARSNVFKLRDIVNVKDPAFGAKGDGTTDDSDAFKAAVAAATAGAVLLVPRSSSYYKIDTSGGLTDAITINKRLTIQLDGDVKATFGAIQANPPTIFYITADDVSIVGQGSLIGDGTVNSVNTGTDSTIPSLVRCTGDNFTMTGVTVDTPYKVGIHLLDCYYAKITDNKFKGGPTVFPTVSTVKPTIANGFYYTCTTGGTSGAVEPTWPVVNGNTVVDGTITWTAQTSDSTTTAQIRMIAPGGGQNNDRSTISRNNVADGRIGISTTYADNCTIEDNRILASVYDINEVNGSNNRYHFNVKDAAPTSVATINGKAASSIDVNYSEGTWTPVISDGTDNATMGGSGSNGGKWTRIGRQVTFTGNIASSALGSVNGAVRVTGLPYSAAAGVGGNTSVSVGFGTNFAIGAGQAVTGTIEGGNNYISLYLWDAVTGATVLDAAEWSDDGSCVVSGSYFA